MTSTYRQLTLSERREISYFLYDKKYSLRHIARLLARNVSTIAREVGRNSCPKLQKYWWKEAHLKHYVRKKYCKFQKNKILSNMKLKEYIDTHLRIGWSPVEVANRIGIDLILVPGLESTSKTAIYSYLRSAHGQLLSMEIWLEKLKRRKKKESLQQSLSIPKLQDRIFIDQRPTNIDERLCFWDWEGDFIVSPRGKRWTLLVLHERKSRFVLIRKLSENTINELHSVIGRIIRPLKCMNSLTLDNDIMFRRHRELSDIIKAPVYFCHPYHSWEKWWVEYSNRLIRRFIPKWTDISTIDEDYILNLEVALNNRPRKCIEYQTPLEVMQEHEQFKTFTTYPCDIWRSL